MALASSGTSPIQTSVEDELLTAIFDLRKRKRMISNRESARRSRMRRQRHVDDLTGQVGRLTKENHQIVARITATSQAYLRVESENSVLRAQANELSRRLLSLGDILQFLNSSKPINCFNDAPDAFFDPLKTQYGSVYEL